MLNQSGLRQALYHYAWSTRSHHSCLAQPHLSRCVSYQVLSLSDIYFAACSLAMCMVKLGAKCYMHNWELKPYTRISKAPGNKAMDNMIPSWH